MSTEPEANEILLFLGSHRLNSYHNDMNLFNNQRGLAPFLVLYSRIHLPFAFGP
jgi:hypothetical protein